MGDVSIILGKDSEIAYTGTEPLIENYDEKEVNRLTLIEWNKESGKFEIRWCCKNPPFKRWSGSTLQSYLNSGGERIRDHNDPLKGFDTYQDAVAYELFFLSRMEGANLSSVLGLTA